MVDISKGIDLFNSADFFAAHDFFEDIWIESEQKDRLFFQGLVQVSVGSYHLICGNYKGAVSQYKKASEKLTKYPPVYYGVDLEKLLSAVEKLQFDLNSFFSKEITEINLKKIPEIEIRNY